MLPYINKALNFRGKFPPNDFLFFFYLKKYSLELELDV